MAKNLAELSTDVVLQKNLNYVTFRKKETYSEK